MNIRHVVVLMLENRSFDSMLGRLYAAGPGFRGLTGAESNVWHKPDGTQEEIGVWTSSTLDARAACIPDPDPGELFTDIDLQLRGAAAAPGAPVTMSGFVDSYMMQPPGTQPADPRAVMHGFTPEQVPVLSRLAAAFGVSDCWHAAAPCQTWPNRFFAHTGTAGGHVNNDPPHFPYTMETVFNRLSDAGQDWRIYFHDIPQTATLSRLWGYALTGHFRDFAPGFAQDAARGALPAYSFIEPRYFTDTLLGKLPNDQHPPHNVAYGEQLIAAVYNALRASPCWKRSLLIVTYDEHGGCYDHVVPPAAPAPGPPYADGFGFDRYGVRVPAVIISPFVRPGSVLRPSGPWPFDHTSIIATLSRLFNLKPLTARDAAAPDLLAVLDGDVANDGPAFVAAPELEPTPAQVAAVAARPANDLQHSLCGAAARLPHLGAALADAVGKLRPEAAAADAVHTLEHAAAQVQAGVRSFLGRI